ncbi:multicomponent Na+:H+ antiporter subunit E [Psychrobacter sp. PL19]|uniref:Na+/H+ antiporter subunit E n=1 Tax=Psychrobacter sp. PL19 TaxID=2760711 RepID=UPI001AE1BE3F
MNHPKLGIERMRIKSQEIDSSAVVLRLLLFSIIWWVLSGGEAGSWVIGAPAVVCAVAVSIALSPPVKVVWWRLVAFMPFFVWQSLKGGIEVAQLAFQPSMSLAPELIEYPLRLSSGLAQVAMINVTSLLPGTLSSEIEGNVLKIHILDSQSNYLAELQRLEQRLGQIFPSLSEQTVREDS